MLEEAKAACDYLIVGLQSDPSLDRPEKNKPVQTYGERLIQLQAVRYVDEVIRYDTEADLLKLLESLRPDVRIIGADYLNRDFTGKQWCLDNNVELFYNSRNHNYSSTELRERIKQN